MSCDGGGATRESSERVTRGSIDPTHGSGLQGSPHSVDQELVVYLTSEASYKKAVRIVGYEGSDSLKRAPTISFIVVGEDGLSKKIQSKEVVAAFDKKGNMGIRWGHFYAFRLCSALMGESSAADGVVRVSFVHYNTVEEVDRLIAVFEEVLV
ncbi:hypothetical protein CALVIDRAFT_603208 [Calocera viscosa TUFC12733]|uniref:Aminotransferase class V domain-containing protein n=1 Tax=Calocera viscosa (strain TUFC12733) TaxID=1330018 RepID=A0A167G2N1_CALVF|nr:hypothetical protein CALVIDRAFT_603208 [Calocera viscosa TUFC12733]